MSALSEALAVGTSVRVVGLAKATQHNGKLGRVCKKAGPEGRIGVKLDLGGALAVKRANLEVLETVAEAPAPKKARASSDEEPRTVTRDNAVLREFNGSRDPTMMALYFHFKDHAFDAFNAAEYYAQLIRYHGAGIRVVAAIPRRMGDNLYSLVCLKNDQVERNTLCELAFQCKRQFVGISMLVKKVCFVCHKPGAASCPSCHCACFCSDACAKRGREAHEPVCRLVRGTGVLLEDEVVEIS
jgi:hypothetical protein